MKGNKRPDYFFRLFLDCCILTIAFSLTREYISGKGDIFFSRFNLLLLLASFFIWYFVATINHLYDDFRNILFSYEFIAFLKTTILHSAIVTFLFFYFFNNYPYPRTFILVYTAISFLLILLQKFIYKQCLQREDINNENIKNVVIVGAGDVGMNFYKTIKDSNQSGYNIVGFVDDSKKPDLNGEYLGKISELETIFENNDIEDVVIALPNGAVNQIEETVITSERNAKRVRIIPNYYRLSSGNISMTNFGNFPMITLRASPLDDAKNQMFKRTFDILFSIFLFITIFSWLFPLIALLIKLTSRGPVFFKQERWGLHNKKLICLKFRSMVAHSKDVDHNGKYNQALRKDPRITKIGRFLRRSNLDELPQFVNVLLGDMSIIGPRPHPMPLNLESKKTIHNYMLRHIVKPGITGWAQVNGCRGETQQSGQMQKRVDFDMWYIDNYSFWLECQIIFQTLINMVKGDKNAF